MKRISDPALHKIISNLEPWGGHFAFANAIEHELEQTGHLQKNKPDPAAQKEMKLCWFARELEKAMQDKAKEEAKAPGFGLTSAQLAVILANCGKPEEIAGTPEQQHERVRELIRWFGREGNPKWFREHAFELVYYIATNAASRHIDLQKATMDAYVEGLNATPQDRDIMTRHGLIKEQP